MTERNKKSSAPKRGIDLSFERITGRIGRTTALIVAIGALVATIFTQYDTIKKELVKHGILTQPPCVSVDSVKFPKIVKLSEWDETKVSLHGHKNCTGPFGLYMTFYPDVRSQRLFALVPPHGNSRDCGGFSASLVPQCWQSHKPLTKGKGEWDLSWGLPPLSLVSNPDRVEQIRVSWEVRDYDNPTKPPTNVDTNSIEIQNDAESTSGK